MKNKKKYIICIFGFLAFLFVFVGYFKLQRKYDRALMYYMSPDVHTEIVHQLEKLKIPYSIDKDGFILYSSENEKKVKEISESAIKKYDPILPNISFPDLKYQKMFLELLKRSNIPFKIRVGEEEADCIEWPIEYDEEVQEMISQVYKSFSSSDKPPFITFSDIKEKEIFIGLLKNEGVPYQIIKSDSTTFLNEINMIDEVLEYDWEHYAKVKKIRTKALSIWRASKRMEKVDTQK